MHPIANPITSIHRFGGAARELQPGSVVGIHAYPGHGKTSFSEALIIGQWSQAGLNGIWWGPEWSYDDLIKRAIQRYGGLTTLEQDRHQAWLVDAAGGKEADPEKLARSAEIAHEMQSWPGVWMTIGSADLTVDQLLKRTDDLLHEGRANGEPISYMVIDSLDWALDLTLTPESAASAINKIKAFAVENQLIMVVTSVAHPEGNVENDDVLPFLKPLPYTLFLYLITKPRQHSSNGTIDVLKNDGGELGQVTVNVNLGLLAWTNDVIE